MEAKARLVRSHARNVLSLPAVRIFAIAHHGAREGGVVTESEVVTGHRALVLQLDGPELCKEAKVVVVVTVVVVRVRIRVSRVTAAGRRRRRKGRVRLAVAVVHPEGAELTRGSIVAVLGGDDGGGGGSGHVGWSRANRLVEPD